MQVGRAGKKIDQDTKIRIAGDLFEMGLRQALRIFHVVRIGSTYYLQAVSFDAFLRDHHTLLSLALGLQRKDISPGVTAFCRFIQQVKFYTDLGVTASVQASQLGQSTAITQGFLQATALGLCEQAQKAKYIEQI
ncbi:hypothetical protein SAMN05192542_11695 [Paraburkholderia caballeronis]|uniref:Uncharacterized protein n=1 Tax=Paraburkholderia caballeronis TaxID=416943 RepID=A0A1H7TUN0_9BURK|nr:hypothetical protein C7403_11795 [Paraburkholderia caballeronis]PXW95403.1 hypothetical protein C7407_11795 [Paraburkholderia caballeronis]RAJ91217.1 hypothetical protein C7409_11795 [Paraburkholderia caballeronis]SEL88228.1 hypothetical protein SAMN05192542_11695 [Paraburkholderia caballeronis]